ncbi:uncharacterized protein LOC111593248 [Drosophila hydei]|uniref:Uncharacterized protein LOC111593248 n=1 Tax=Drosophila hydei TaxID=7224 RepID=A0A6J1L5B3_DROHY|nr:uncharacterized protein LOC111593248 [Drosophila hydei]
MKKFTFILDIIVTRVESFKVKDLNLKKLKVQIRFNELNLVVSNNFEAPISIVFQANVDKLRQALVANGIPIAIIYCDRSLGKCKITLPPSVTNTIKEHMADLSFSSLCAFKKYGQEAGTIEVLCRLLPKFRKPKEAELQIIISPLSKDLKCYEHFITDVSNPKKSDVAEPFSKLNKLIREYENLMDSSVKKPDLLKTPGCTDHTDDCANPTPLVSNDLKLTQINPRRCCPICLNSMSFLPTFATCPNCFIKSMAMKGKPW